jgi:hypothetical protein
MEDDAEKAIPVDVKGVDALSPDALIWFEKALGFPRPPIPAPPNIAMPVDWGNSMLWRNGLAPVACG